MKVGHTKKIIRPKDQKVFKVGQKVYWSDPDWMFEDQEYQKEYQDSIFTGNIGNIMLIQYDWDKEDQFSIEVSLNNESPHCLGRLPINDIEFDPEDLKDVCFYDSDYWDQVNGIEDNNENE